MTADLVAFLRARYDEDERIARRATPGPWCDCGGYVTDIDSDGNARVQVTDYGTQDGEPEDPAPQGEADSAHIARHDPARVLADIDAKRELLDEHQDVNDGSCGTCVDGQWGYPTHGGSSPQRYPCRTLRLLAVPFADHPDYREEWRP